ncbi:hypothetical protein BKA64DRAFT_759483 [Cadophora sp. MPI-SDFR-AT-0126]|nr:hypothetical protein BKA64DRAFT_759483 [Leotiomycetes sp. MPI-SDFR-AT-0126]
MDLSLRCLIYVDPAPAPASASTARLEHDYPLVVMGTQAASNRHNAQTGAANKHVSDKIYPSHFSRPGSTSKSLQSAAYVSPYPTIRQIGQQTEVAQASSTAYVDNIHQSPPKKKARTAYGPVVRWKYEILEASFKKNDTPDEEEIHRIVERTGMDWRKVTKHFSDKRLRMRKLASVQVSSEDEAQVEIQRKFTSYLKGEISEPPNSTVGQAILNGEECTACVQQFALRKSISIGLPALDALPRYVRMTNNAILNIIQSDINHEKYRIGVFNTSISRMERDHHRFACSLEMAMLQRIAHQARITGLTFMLEKLDILSKMGRNDDSKSWVSILADLDDRRLCLTTSKLLAKAQFPSIVNKLKDNVEEASARVTELEPLVSEQSVGMSASRLRAYNIYLVEWQARCLVYRLALTSFVAMYYDIEKRVVTHSSD